MFCVNCGNELLGDARFCSRCGTPRPSPGSSQQPGPSPAASVAARPRPGRSKNLKDLIHTFDWAGTCPACGLVHTYETALCPNDGKPLVVALDGTRHLLTDFPVQTAHIRCFNNCGYVGGGIDCNNDGTAISSVHLKFRMPLFRTFIHNVRFLIPVLIVIPLNLVVLYFAISFVIEFRANCLKMGGFANAFATNYWMFLMYGFPYIFISGFTGKVFFAATRKWWPFRRTFDFHIARRGPWIRNIKDMVKQEPRF